MTTVESTGSAEPVGQQGALVDIRQQPRAGGQRLARRRGARRLHRRDGGRRPGRHRMALDPAGRHPARGHHARGGAPGAGLSGPILRPLRRHGRPSGVLGGAAPHAQATGERASPQFRDRPPQGQRCGRQPGRDRGDRGLAGRRHREGDLRGRQLRELRLGAGGVGAASRGDQPSLRRHHRTPERPCAAPPTSSRPSWPGRSRNGWPSRGSRSSRFASRTWPTQRRSRRRCCVGNRPTRSWRRATRIVEGAVGMVEMALSRLSEGGVVSLDEERTASMVSNLMVVLCGDQPPSPVVNAGSLYT